MLSHRAAVGLDDLAIANGLTSAAWLGGSPFVAATPAGIEWWHTGSWPDELGDHLRLWFLDDEPVAWTWLDSGELEWHVWTGDANRDADITRRIVDSVLAEAAGTRVAAWAAEDDGAVLEMFDTLGFRPTTRRLSQWQQRLGAGAGDPGDPGDPGDAGDTGDTGDAGEGSVPAGYRIRGLAGPAEIAARVELHRAAFTGSRLTVAKFERLVDLPHYRYADDLVVEAPDGTLAAFALAWWDPVGLIGEFEPVGTHPDHRRLGLARALLHHGVHRFATLGAQVVQVYADPDATGPDALYESAGFRRRAFHREFEHGQPASVPPAPGSATDLQSMP